MESLEGEADEKLKAAAAAAGGICRSVVMELPLGDAAETFVLEKAVCSHGLFMMAPNHWDPLTKTFQRPLRLDCDNVSVSSSSSSSTSLFVRISHPSDTPRSLSIHVFGTDSLSPQHQQSLLIQVRRMLRLSLSEELNVREFQKICGEAKERGFGRVFRSPTVFEDMVKCILLCNCQWSRTLSMAEALCELQLELQCHSYSASVSEADGSSNSRSPTAETAKFTPETPAGKESKRKLHKSSTNLASRFVETRAEMEADAEAKIDCIEMLECLQGTEKLSPTFYSSNNEDFYVQCNSCQTSSKIYETVPCSFSDLQTSECIELYPFNKIGNFPSPRELASLNEQFLAKRCNLGYRASRVLNLARSVVEGRIQLTQLEEACSEPNVSNYNKLAEQLKEIDGFGPFTCANLLMCMGFYHVIPTDSETIRHLKQVHSRGSTIQRVQRDVEAIYGKYAPFQFLAYWSEVWHFYEGWFGKLSEMPHSDYKLITAANMRHKMRGKCKRTKIS